MSIDIQLGGPDPFPEEKKGDCPAGENHYFCTRNAGHEPPHVALADVVVAVWPPYTELPIRSGDGFA